ncbi:MAG: hypothetical protein K1X72_22010, partial [Pyrinomonadaceae bacterium]|nr:hypothetical protein [Pyrinomonadaceae bacterium]
MNQNKQQNQSRFLIAAVLSMIVLLVWSYYFAPKKTPNANVDANSNANAVAANNQATPTPQPESQPAQQTAVTPDDTPNKTISIKSPLYQVKLDSKGAIATSWILIKNVRQGAKEIDLWADSSTENNKVPLELILQDNPKREY